MKNTQNRRWIITGMLFLLFVLFTLTVSVVDVQPVGPEQSEIGLATLNTFVFENLGVHMGWYQATEVLGMAVLLVPVCFAALGLYQLIRRKSLRKMDAPLLALGAFYVAVAICYVLFEKVIINYRPVLLDEGLEASYPSSHTMLSICIMSTAMIFLRSVPAIRPSWRTVFNALSVLIVVVIVSGRLLAGVHWLTDIIGGVLLSAALVMLYASAVAHIGSRK